MGFIGCLHANYYTADEIRNAYNIPYTNDNRTVSNFIDRVYKGDQNKLKSENKYWLSKKRYDVLKIYHGWKKN